MMHINVRIDVIDIKQTVFFFWLPHILFLLGFPTAFARSSMRKFFGEDAKQKGQANILGGKIH